jgi:hypothetical protein
MEPVGKKKSILVVENDLNDYFLSPSELTPLSLSSL